MTKKHTIIAGIGLACFLIIASCSSVLAALTGGTGGLGGADLNYQCDSVMGPDSSGVISLPEQPAGVASSDIPTTKPLRQRHRANRPDRHRRPATHP